MGNYLYLPVIALICYSFLLCAFLGYKKNKLIACFLQVLLACILWTLGSVLMRGNVGSLYEIWFHISLLGILLIPYTLGSFMVYFLAERHTLWMKLIGISILPVYIINCFTGIFLAPPALVETVAGTSFVYTPTLWVVVLFLAPVWFCGKVILVSYHSYKDEMVSVSKLMPVLCGALAILVGNLLVLIPAFEGIPLDILACNVNAFLLFYALHQKRLFKLSGLFSPASTALLAIGVTGALFWAFLDTLDHFLTNTLSLPGDADMVTLIILFGTVTWLNYLILVQVSKGIFVKEEIRQNELLKDFSVSVSKSLNRDTILDELLHVVRQTLSVQNVYIFLPDATSGIFQIRKTGNPLHNRQVELARDNPMVKYLQDHNDLLHLRDFRRTTAYKSLWETEKATFQELQMEYIAPLHNENQLVGFVMLCKRSVKKDHYSADELSFLSSVASVASIALKNAMMYEKACYEARTDELTGLYNRKYFHTILEEQFHLCQKQSLTLVILSVDDFKLYNQLYGNSEGDIALRNIAHLIKNMVGSHGLVARYSGKEFAIILPCYDAISAKELTSTICKKIENINKQGKDYAMKCLTISAGICSIPYGATTLKQLLSNVDLAVYQVKQNGKNAIAIYSEGVTADESPAVNQPQTDIYAAYSSTIFALTAAIDTKDHYTFQHSNNVAYYACQLARAYGLNEDSVKIIHEAALLHDIGKIGIREDILNKPGKLTADEYEVMKSHVENSIGIIRHLPSLDYVVPAVIGHHEWYNGNGYPRRIGGEDSPLAARILCIADSFDAMISKRSYKEAMPISRGLAIVESELGNQFDPNLGRLFIQQVQEGHIVPRQNQESIT